MIAIGNDRLKAANQRTADNIRPALTGWSAVLHKLDALTRILEAEPFDDDMIVFVRTKTATR